MTYTFTFPGHCATVNQLYAGHWGRKAKLKRRDRDIVGIAVKVAGVPRATGKRRVSIHLTMGYKMRTPDPDGIYKSLLDSLVQCGALLDDRKETCEITPPTFGRGKVAETVVVLEDV